MKRLALFLLLTTAANAQHVHPDEVITDQRVATFYETWFQPIERKISCCDKRDCYAAEVRKNHGVWEYLHKWTGTWHRIPNHVIESNTPTPRESPDGRNHVCASPIDGDIVYCAVFSSGS